LTFGEIMGCFLSTFNCFKKREEEEEDPLGVNTYSPGAPETPRNVERFPEFMNPQEPQSPA
jgi:hypothetical protein